MNILLYGDAGGGPGNTLTRRRDEEAMRRQNVLRGAGQSVVESRPMAAGPSLRDQLWQQRRQERRQHSQFGGDVDALERLTDSHAAPSYGGGDCESSLHLSDSSAAELLPLLCHSPFYLIHVPPLLQIIRELINLLSIIPVLLILHHNTNTTKVRTEGRK